MNDCLQEPFRGDRPWPEGAGRKRLLQGGEGAAHAGDQGGTRGLADGPVACGGCRSGFLMQEIAQ